MLSIAPATSYVSCHGLHASAAHEVIPGRIALVLHGRSCCRTVPEGECNAYADHLGSCCMQVSLLKYLHATPSTMTHRHRACTGSTLRCNMLIACSQGFAGDRCIPLYCPFFDRII